MAQQAVESDLCRRCLSADILRQATTSEGKMRHIEDHITMECRLRPNDPSAPARSQIIRDCFPTFLQGQLAGTTDLPTTAEQADVPSQDVVDRVSAVETEPEPGRGAEMSPGMKRKRNRNTQTGSVVNAFPHVDQDLYPSLETKYNRLAATSHVTATNTAQSNIKVLPYCQNDVSRDRQKPPIDAGDPQNPPLLEGSDLPQSDSNVIPLQTTTACQSFTPINPSALQESWMEFDVSSHDVGVRDYGGTGWKGAMKARTDETISNGSSSKCETTGSAYITVEDFDSDSEADGDAIEELLRDEFEQPNFFTMKDSTKVNSKSISEKVAQNITPLMERQPTVHHLVTEKGHNAPSETEDHSDSVRSNLRRWDSRSIQLHYNQLQKEYAAEMGLQEFLVPYKKRRDGGGCFIRFCAPVFFSPKLVLEMKIKAMNVYARQMSLSGAGRLVSFYEKPDNPDEGQRTWVLPKAAAALSFAMRELSSSLVHLLRNNFPKHSEFVACPNFLNVRYRELSEEVLDSQATPYREILQTCIDAFDEQYNGISEEEKKLVLVETVYRMNENRKLRIRRKQRKPPARRGFGASKKRQPPVGVLDPIQQL